ncbi:hypothetical protein Tco_0108112, partial [Tanacetum coccineum]
PLKKVSDEAVHKELGDKMERTATTASSLEAEQQSGKGCSSKGDCWFKEEGPKVGKETKIRPIGLKRLRKVGESRRVKSSEDKDRLGAQEDASKQGRSLEDIDKDAKVSLADET